jgi:UDP-N-acetylglucosamine--N-acetylmuramyl-(pentapeptide) pyrophosphoryl-undecaprenol N-acetylglucosamine transferase
VKVLISGGGTGGHIYPGIAIAKALQEKYPDVQIVFVGTDSGLEADVVPKAGFKFRGMELQGFKRKTLLGNIGTVFKAVRACFGSFSLIRAESPDIVIGTGGYVCGPVLLCAALLRIPTLIQEQNAFPGITNRILSGFVRKVATGYEESLKYFRRPDRVVVTGNPIRKEIMARTRNNGIRAFNLDPDKRTLLVFGASQGARTINDVMLGALPWLKQEKNLQVIWVTGKGDYNRVCDQLDGIEKTGKGNIIIRPYLDNMEDAYAVANLVVCRGGAISLAEITARGLPAIIVPYPYATDNHQEYNAKALEKRGAALMVKDEEFTSDRFDALVKELFNNPTELLAMARNSLECGKPDATLRVLDCIEELIRK